MQIFLINLPEDVTRREAIEGQLRGLGVLFEIFPAIRGSSLSSQEKAQHYDEKWFVRNEGHPASPSELGCCLSHLAIYRIMRERDIPHALILEDDAWLNPNLPNLLDAIEQKYDPQQRDLILLSWTAAISMRSFETLWSTYKVAEVRSAVCTHGYVISNAAARALADALYPVRHKADCFGWLRRHRVVNLRAVIPTCITLDLSHESANSTIFGQSLSRSIMGRIAHKAFRGWWLAIDHSVALVQRIGQIL